jgi:[ribosomal protein S5]-alanine N-acetyltransferase
MSAPALPSLATRITTARLVLRAPRVDDVGPLRAALRSNEAHLQPFTPEPPPGTAVSTITAVSKSIARQRTEWRTGRAFSLLVWPPPQDPQRVLGRVALTGIMRGAFHSAYLGYWVDHRLQGQGIGTELVGAAVAFAFGPAGLHRVQAAIMPRNERSVRLIKRLGFRQEGLAERYLQIAGTWEDHAIFALTREEWDATARAIGPTP